MSSDHRPEQPRAFRGHNSASWRFKENNSSLDDAKMQTSAAGSWKSKKTGTLEQDSSSADTNLRLYVGNLPYQALSKDVEDLFTTHNFSLKKIDISTDPFTGRNPSYCFVELETRAEADRAMQELTGKEILGRPIKVKPHVAKSDGSINNPRSNPRVTTYDQMGRGRQPRQQSPQRFSPIARNEYDSRTSFDRWSRNDAPSHWKGVSDQGCRLYVGGLPRIEPHSAVEAEMQELFSKFETTAVSKIINPHKSKRDITGNHYYLFVDLPTSQEATSAALALDGFSSKWGGNLRVSWAKGDSGKVVREQFSRAE